MGNTFEIEIKSDSGDTIGPRDTVESKEQERLEKIERQREKDQRAREQNDRANRAEYRAASKEQQREINRLNRERKKAAAEELKDVRSKERERKKFEREEIIARRQGLAEERQANTLRRRFINDMFGAFNQAHLGRRVNHAIDFIQQSLGRVPGRGGGSVEQLANQTSSQSTDRSSTTNQSSNTSSTNNFFTAAGAHAAGAAANDFFQRTFDRFNTWRRRRQIVDGEVVSRPPTRQPVVPPPRLPPPRPIVQSVEPEPRPPRTSTALSVPQRFVPYRPPSTVLSVPSNALITGAGGAGGSATGGFIAGGAGGAGGALITGGGAAGGGGGGLVAGGVGAAGAAGGAAGIALTGLTVAAGVVTVAVGLFSAALIAGNLAAGRFIRQLEDLPSELTFAKVESEMDKFANNMRRAGEFGGALADFERSKSDLSIASTNLFDAALAPLIPIGAEANELLTNIFEMITPVIGIISKFNFEGPTLILQKLNDIFDYLGNIGNHGGAIDARIHALLTFLRISFKQTQYDKKDNDALRELYGFLAPGNTTFNNPRYRFKFNGP